MEQKFQIGNEFGTIIWDVEAMLQNVSGFTIRKFSVKKLASQNRFSGNIEYAMTTDTSLPLIVVQLNDGFDKLIDGNHRLQKCIMEGRMYVTAYYLTFEEHIKYILNFDSNLYWRVVNHWGKQ